jgi:uncharacterized protein with PIN domain
MSVSNDLSPLCAVLEGGDNFRSLISALSDETTRLSALAHSELAAYQATRQADQAKTDQAKTDLDALAEIVKIKIADMRSRS